MKIPVNHIVLATGEFRRTNLGIG